MREPSPLAGKPAPASIWVNLPRLVTAYFAEHPDPAVPEERVAFGTSGHRGSSTKRGFNEAHVLATTQAICDYRAGHRVIGPLFLGIDTHALSEPAFSSALEVLIANGIDTMIDRELGYTPTPVISHAILRHNVPGRAARADGIVITPSHNPPEDGGIKYNPWHGGPAESDVTRWIERRANEILRGGLKRVPRVAYARALADSRAHRHDYLSRYLDDLPAVIDLEAIRAAGLRIGVDALGGAALGYWAPLAARYGLDLSVANASPDAAFRFMSADWDGRIRMDCSSPYAMAGLVAIKDRYDIAFANDTDVDRHGIVTPKGGLMPPNAYLAVAIDYLFTHRPDWPGTAGIGKTLVSSALIDRVAARLGRPLVETPVGFKWFVEGLREGALGFAGEESAGASFLRRDARVWTTDKDGIILGLLAAEMTAKTGRAPDELYRNLVRELGEPCYARSDAPATRAQKEALQRLTGRDLDMALLAGDAVRAVLDAAPGNNAAFGGIKVVSDNGWFAVRPSGTEDVYKLYAESFVGPEHLRRIQEEAQRAISAALAR
ncbi:MAG: phosphoglucomutase (alpha-D-glucose-1,6-bisphosphate-dependent) [Betaproteobacteria bacterium]|nr:phosphoglucomutase (alpha-D-glucose-1,6-bisphosphate-dependent) [Betaproteobacteria bacterium]